MSTDFAQLPTRTAPFPSWIDKYLDPNNSTYVELKSTEQLYGILSSFMVKKINQSYQMSPKENVSEAARLLQKLAKEAHAKSQKKSDNNKDSSDDTTVSTGSKQPNTDENKQNEEEEDDDDDKVTLQLGLGIHEVNYKNEKLYLIHQTVGQPDCPPWGCNGPQFHKSLVLIVSGRNKLSYLKMVCNDAIKSSENSKDSMYFSIYRWDCESAYWRWSGRKIGRNLDTIILPSSIKKKLVDDVTRFLDKESIKWYFEHGIPYKRSYLFYGVPGSGKSSLIQGIAAKYNRNLAFLQPTHPKMTDDSFKSCIQSAPANSLIVLEDIDALFNKDRSKKHKGCPLTFSGLLNGLDGVGNPDGQIFILTTNFVDQLDEALIRSGRVDLHIQFPMATDEQLKDIFLLFYPENINESNEFVTAIRKNFEKGLSMAAVQQHFIQTMFKPAKEVVDAVKDLGKRLDVVAELNEKTIVEEDDDDEDDGKDENKEDVKEMTKDNVVEGLKESFKQLENLAKDNEEFGKLLESLVKSYNDECKKISEKEKEEKDKDKDKDDSKDKDEADDKEKEKEKTEST